MDEQVKEFDMQEFLKPRCKVKVGDRIYRNHKNMTIPGGIVDSSIDLSFEKLKELKRLVNEEYKAKKPK